MNALLPLSNKATLLHKAIAECAYFGCDSIWITCEYAEQTLYKKIVGSYVNDPLHYYFKLDPKWPQKVKRIPIFFVPMNTRDIGVRDSNAWGYINAAAMAMKVHRTISSEFNPKFFYAAPLEGVYSAEVLSRARSLSRSDAFEGILVQYQNSDFRDDLQTGFTFTVEDLKTCEKHVNESNLLSELVEYKEEDIDYPAKNFLAMDVFRPIKTDRYWKMHLREYYDVRSWTGYKKVLAGEKSRIKYPMHIFDTIDSKKENAAIPEMEFEELDLGEVYVEDPKSTQ